MNSGSPSHLSEKRHLAVLEMEKNPPESHPDLESDNWVGKGDSLKYAVAPGVETPLEQTRRENPDYLREHAMKLGLIKP